MRGIPGCGKSTFVQRNYPHAVICSADHFFMQEGTYQFDINKLGAAHLECFRKFQEAMQRSEPVIVIDNTNTRIREMQKYIDEAALFGYSVSVVRVLCHPEEAARRNTHGVPAEKIQEMHDRFQDWPGEQLA